MFLGVSLQCWLHLFTSSLFHQPFSPLILLLFLKYFYFTNFLYRDYFLPGVHFSVVVPRVLRIWERFFHSQVFFTLQSFPTFDTTCFYQGFPGAGGSILKVPGLPTEVRNTDRPICLFELHSMQQKVLFVGSIYASKALSNIITTCSWFWTHHLIAIRILRGISYPLGHISS